ncbi:MAG: putative signal transducing protein [Rhodanobacteraceae bacterium]
MRTVYHAEGIVDAHLVKDALEQAGIPAFVNGEYLIGGMGQLPARDFLTVSVPDVAVEAAAPVVREVTDMLRTPASEMVPQHPLRLKPAPV